MTKAEDCRPRIVVGVDGSDQSKLALRWAARIAAAEGARLEAIIAWELPTLAYGYVGSGYSPRDEMHKVLIASVDDVFEGHRPDGMQLRSLSGSAAGVLLEASRDALMVVVGSRGHGGFVGLLLGSVSARVAEHATCPVLVVHEPKTHPDAATKQDTATDQDAAILQGAAS
jgi:nucleotide-binding universal stress UspA family protein